MFENRKKRNSCYHENTNEIHSKQKPYWRYQTCKDNQKEIEKKS